ncbi:unnamed protein product, partial [Rotaria socialis]
DKNRLSSSSSDVKLSPLGSTNNNKSQTNNSSLSPQQQTNRHYCSHPECGKVNRSHTLK